MTGVYSVEPAASVLVTKCHASGRIMRHLLALMTIIDLVE